MSRRLRAAGAATGLVLLAVGCAGPTVERDAGDPAEAIGHTHAVAREPGTGRLLLATHHGLYRLEQGRLAPVGPQIDLMGFTVATDGSYLASGHPGPGVDLDQPVGLITSTDGGATWTSLSRSGESDFHTLTASSEAVYGFDGALRSTRDRRSWQELPIPAGPYSLAARPDGGQLIATTEAGVLASTDGGSTWTPLRTPAPVLLVAWAGLRTLVGLTPDGRVLQSTDAGRSWTVGAAAAGEPSAMTAGTAGGGRVEVVAATGTRVLRTTDGGATWEVLLG